MHLAVIGSSESWYFKDLLRAAGRRHRVSQVTFRDMTSRIDEAGLRAASRGAEANNREHAEIDLQTVDCLLVRTMPPGGLEQVIFRMDVLNRLAQAGVTVMNPPRAVEVAVDKYLATAKLREAGFLVPRTIVCQTWEDGMEAFAELGGDVVLKPLFGSEGRGIARLNDEALALRAFKMLAALGAVLYLQEYIDHEGCDLRLLTIGERVHGIRRRNSLDWRTNVARGATPEPLEVTAELREAALRAAGAVGAPLAGVDLLPGKDGRLYAIEVNAVPGWKGLAGALGIDVAGLIIDYLETVVSPRAAGRHMSVSSTHGELNIAQRLTTMAAAMPDAVAVAAPRGYAAGRRQYDRVTFAELEADASAIARGLIELGVRPGTRLALLVRPGIEFVALVFGLFRAGATTILIDPGMGRKNLLACLAAAEPRGFVAISLAQAIRVASRRFPQATINVTVGRRWFWGGETLASLRRRGARSRAEFPAMQADDPAAIIFTTGSTGPPKGVLYTHGNFATQVVEIRDRYDIQPGEIDLAGFPLFGLFNAAMGVTTVVPDMDAARPAAVDPRKILEAANDWQVTQSFGSPAIWNRVGRYCETHDARLPTLRRVLSAGAPVPAHVLARMKACIHPQGEVHTPYGATEALPVASASASEVLQQTVHRTRQGAGVCVGTRFSSIQWKVVRIAAGPLPTLDDAELLPPGEIGELIVRGPQVTARYATRTEWNALAKIADGEGCWHRMGDAGYLDGPADDPATRFWFCGRVAHRVVTAGGPLYTVCCEAIFNEHPEVVRSALVGIGPSDAQTPVLIAQLAPEAMPGEQRILGELAEIAGAHALTAGIVHFLARDEFPVDIRHNAKIFREQLAPWAADQLQQGANTVKALVTGANGFLGLYLVEQLVARGDEVRAMCRNRNAALDRLPVETFLADIRDRPRTMLACHDVDVVFHTAAVAGIWGPWRHYYETNVVGTRNVIAGCRAHGVRRLVFTSSPSVTFDGRPQERVDETARYPRRWNCHYPHTKAIAEQEVLAQNGGDLHTCALRPHLIWGPRDGHLIPRLIARARGGQLRRVGDGANLIDITYVENAAEAHWQAADRLFDGSPVAGRAYFISQGTPVNCWQWIDEVLALAGLPRVERAISLRAARYAGGALEAMQTLLRRKSEPRMSRFLAAQLGTSHYFNIQRAREDFGYNPRVSTEEGMQRLAASLKEKG